jgi:hypothetical protein
MSYCITFRRKARPVLSRNTCRYHDCYAGHNLVKYDGTTAERWLSYRGRRSDPNILYNGRTRTADLFDFLLNIYPVNITCLIFAASLLHEVHINNIKEQFCWISVPFSRVKSDTARFRIASEHLHGFGWMPLPAHICFRIRRSRHLHSWHTSEACFFYTSNCLCVWYCDILNAVWFVRPVGRVWAQWRGWAARSHYTVSYEWPLSTWSNNKNRNLTRDSINTMGNICKYKTSMFLFSFAIECKRVASRWCARNNNKTIKEHWIWTVRNSRQWEQQENVIVSWRHWKARDPGWRRSQ